MTHNVPGAFKVSGTSHEIEYLNIYILRPDNFTNVLYVEMISADIFTKTKPEQVAMKDKKASKLLYSPLFFGVTAGALAVLAQPLFKIQPPQAYGICTVCHARDLLNWLSSVLFSMKIEAADVSIYYPLLTTVGLVIGSVVSSKLNGEYRRIRSEKLLTMFVLGIIVSNVGLLIMSCPTRLVLRFAFADPYASLGLIGLIFGISIGVIVLKWRAK